jgi:hypothetical protein
MMVADTQEQLAAQVAALLRERAGYVEKGLDDRVAAVDAELRRLGQRAAAPAQRAEKRA